VDCGIALQYLAQNVLHDVGHVALVQRMHQLFMTLSNLICQIGELC